MRVYDLKQQFINICFRKIKELKMKTQGKCEEGAVPENVAFDDDGMDGFQPIEEEEDDL